MEAITHPSPCAVQMSGRDPEMRDILSVLVKRTYRILPDGRCVRADEEVPLVLGPEADPAEPELLLDDLDVYPMKPLTDVVVQGHVGAGGASRVLQASVQVGAYQKAIAAVGERRCGLSATGALLFSEPEWFDRIPLRYDLAYGGRDAVAEARYGNPLDELRRYLPASFDLSQASPFLYPRNPCGRGYLMEATRDAVDALALPRLEDPYDPLTPERLPVGTPGRWPRMPLPQGTGWVNHTWFPRIAYFGVLPPHDPPGGDVAEVARGWAPPGLMRGGPQTETFDFRFANGASLGLQLPYLNGDEVCSLTHLSPRQSTIRFQLPGERPRIWTDGRKGKLNETEPVIHTVVIRPDDEIVSVVWRGSAPALRPYMPEELERMPLRVEWPD